MSTQPEPSQAAKSKTPTEQQSAGLSASADLLGVLVGHVLTSGSNWSLRIRRAGSDGNGRTSLLRHVGKLRGVLYELADSGSGLSSGVDAQIHPHESGAFKTPGCDSLYAATVLSVGIHLPHLFAEGGPLFDPALLAADGKLVPGALGGGRMQLARRFAVEHARQFVFRPSAALASYDTVYLFFLISEPVALSAKDKERIDRVQCQLARLVHGGYARKIGNWIPLPLPYSKGGKSFVTSRLLWARKDLVYELKKLDDWTRTEEPALAVQPRAQSGRQGRRRRAPEMRLRTLMDDYELVDLDLPDTIRQLIAAGHCPGRSLMLDELPLLVDAMARAGYGFEDVRIVVADTRFPLSYSAHIDGSKRQGLALRFSQTIRARNEAYGARLPYGITGIVLLADGDGRTVDRYVVTGGTKGSPFRIEVSHDVLISAKRFHRALSSHLKGFPYQVPQEVWEEIVLSRGLRDPRIVLGRSRTPKKNEAPLVERIGRFTAEAKPLEPCHWESGDSIPWPVLRDGQVVFRLAAVSDYLAREIEGPAPSRGEVAAAVRAAGGAPYGAMRFGGRVIRVWTLPYAGRPRGPAPAPGRGRAPA